MPSLHRLRISTPGLNLLRHFIKSSPGAYISIWHGLAILGSVQDLRGQANGLGASRQGVLCQGANEVMHCHLGRTVRQAPSSGRPGSCGTWHQRPPFLRAKTQYIFTPSHLARSEAHRCAACVLRRRLPRSKSTPKTRPWPWWWRALLDPLRCPRQNHLSRELTPAEHTPGFATLSFLAAAADLPGSRQHLSAPSLAVALSRTAPRAVLSRRITRIPERMIHEEPSPDRANDLPLPHRTIDVRQSLLTSLRTVRGQHLAEGQGIPFRNCHILRENRNAIPLLPGNVA